MNRFRCIHTDQRNACQLATVTDLNSVAIDDSGYGVGGVPDKKFSRIRHQGCCYSRSGVDTRCGSISAETRSEPTTVVILILPCSSVVMAAVGTRASGMRVC